MAYREEGFFSRPALHREQGRWQLELVESRQPSAPDHMSHQVLPLSLSLPHHGRVRQSVLLEHLTPLRISLASALPE